MQEIFGETSTRCEPNFFIYHFFLMLVCENVILSNFLLRVFHKKVTLIYLQTIAPIKLYVRTGALLQEIDWNISLNGDKSDMQCNGCINLSIRCIVTINLLLTYKSQTQTKGYNLNTKESEKLQGHNLLFNKWSI